MPGNIRLGTTRLPIAYHVDFADAVALLCLEKAAEGGMSRIVSSVRIFLELARRHPELAERLFSNEHILDTRVDANSICNFFLPLLPRSFSHLSPPLPPLPPSQGTAYPRFIPLRVLAVAGDGKVRTSYNGDYLRSAWNHPDSPSGGRGVPAHLAALYDAYEALAGSQQLEFEMDLEPGDIQLISNHYLLHSRTGFRDTKEAQRSLLRLWLTFGEEMPWEDRLRRHAERLSLLGGLAWAHLRRWMHSLPLPSLPF